MSSRRWTAPRRRAQLGFGFGAVLEMGGFGDTRKLAAQFYFRDMTVLKVEVSWPAYAFTKKVKLQTKAAVKGGCG